MAEKTRRQNFQTIAWLWDLRKRGLLDMDPPYQRRSVWNQAYKDGFIDTVLLQYPAPAIFLYEEISPDGKALYHVVDGKQRLTAIFEFADGEFPVAEESAVSHLSGRYFEQLSNEEKTAFWTYQFSTEYLPTNEETIVNTIFERINKNTAKLTRQELRHARFGGLFITLVEEMAELMAATLPEGFPRIESRSRKQMKDVELAANLLLFFEEGIQGYSQDEMDKAFSDRDSNWEASIEVKKRFLKTLDCLAKLAALPEDAPLSKTRLRNQADFYSIFTAVAEATEGRPDCTLDENAARRLSGFIALVEDEEKREDNRSAAEYYRATRSNSNDAGPRKTRTKILVKILQGEDIDHPGGN